MESDNVTMPVEYSDYLEPEDGSPLTKDELVVDFLVVKPQHTEQECLNEFRVPHRLLESEELSKIVIPHLLSYTTIPKIYHHCPEFILVVSEYVSSLPSDTHRVHVYNVVLDVAETPKFLWVYNFMRDQEQSTSIGEEVKLEVEGLLDCTICLQELKAGTAATAMLPCSHLFHPSCVLRWFLQSDNCPLCHFRVRRCNCKF